MEISTIKGHLTATEKTHIKALFEAKMMNGKVNRKVYFIENIGENIYQVKVYENQKNDFGQMKTEKSTKHFYLKK